MPFNEHLMRPTHRDICHQHELSRLSAADRIVALAGILLPVLLAESLAYRGGADDEGTDELLADAGRRAIRAAQLFERESLQFRAECPGGEVSPATATATGSASQLNGRDHHTS